MNRDGRKVLRRRVGYLFLLDLSTFAVYRLCYTDLLVQWHLMLWYATDRGKGRNGSGMDHAIAFYLCEYYQLPHHIYVSLLPNLTPTVNASVYCLLLFLYFRGWGGWRIGVHISHFSLLFSIFSFSPFLLSFLSPLNSTSPWYPLPAEQRMMLSERKSGVKVVDDMCSCFILWEQKEGMKGKKKPPPMPSFRCWALIPLPFFSFFLVHLAVLVFIRSLDNRSFRHVVYVRGFVHMPAFCLVAPDAGGWHVDYRALFPLASFSHACLPFYFQVHVVLAPHTWLHSCKSCPMDISWWRGRGF